MPKRLKRSKVVYGRVTPAEKDKIRNYADAKGTDISNLTRDVLLREVDSPIIDTTSRLTHLYVRATRAALELRDGFTIENFRSICEELDITA